MLMLFSVVMLTSDSLDLFLYRLHILKHIAFMAPSIAFSSCPRVVGVA